MSAIYLRDLKEGPIKEEILREIRKKRPDLLAAIEEGDDVEIGEYAKPEDYTT